MTKNIELDEFNSSAGNGAQVPEPVSKGATKRPADSKNAGETMPKINNTVPGQTGSAEMINYFLTQMATGDGRDMMQNLYNKVKAETEAKDRTNTNNNTATTTPSAKSITLAKEELEALFVEAGLSEDFSTKASTIFEAVLNVKMTELEETVAAGVQELVNEARENIAEEMSQQVEDYLKYVTEQWVEANELSIETGIRAEMAESFMKGLYNLFNEHHVNIPEDAEEVVENLVAQVEELQASLDEEIARNIEAKKALEEVNKELAFEEVAESLTDVEREKLRTLAEGVEAGSVDEFVEKVKTLKESVFKSSTTKTALNEESLKGGEPLVTEEATSRVGADPGIDAVVKALSRTVKR